MTISLINVWYESKSFSSKWSFIQTKHPLGECFETFVQNSLFLAHPLSFHFLFSKIVWNHHFKMWFLKNLYIYMYMKRASSLVQITIWKTWLIRIFYYFVGLKSQFDPKLWIKVIAFKIQPEKLTPLWYSHHIKKENVIFFIYFIFSYLARGFMNFWI